MISHNHQCIFIHIPRTGGSSIEQLIWPEKREEELWMGFIDRYSNKYQTGGLQHLLAKQIKQEIGDYIFRKYWKFTLIRNPWEKILSTYLSIKWARPDIREFIGMKPNDNFQKFLDLTEKKGHTQWEPQFRFIYDDNGVKLVDYIGRYERYDNDVITILQKIGIYSQIIPHIYSSNSKNYIHLYDQETKERVSERYHQDIDLFNYEFPEEDL